MWGLLLALTFVLLAEPAEAHTRRRSYSHWWIQENLVEIKVRFDVKNVAELIVGPGLERGSIGPRTGRQLTEVASALVDQGVRLSQAGAPCPLSVERVYDEGRQLVVEAHAQCEREVEDGGLSVLVDLFDGAPMDHTHFMRASFGGEVYESVFSGGGQRFDFARGGMATRQSSSQMVLQGLIHVLTGADHVAFVLTLICVTWYVRRATGSWRREILALALAFTIGHSVTLVLATLEAVRPDEATVEWLIAFSVAGVACDGLLRVDRRRSWQIPVIGFMVVVLAAAASAELVVPQALAIVGGGMFLLLLMTQRDPGPGMRAWIALAFGLIHGFGFASALAEGGFSGQSAVFLLFAFNVGVELGQLVVIGAGFAVLMLLRDRLRPSLTVDIVCGAVLSLGCYWMALRL